jgi:hypothetical protein
MSVGKMGKFIDLTGKQFGRWTVIEEAGRNVRGNALWLCRCSCSGTEKIIVGACLRNGSSNSCGCLQRERVSQSNKGKQKVWKSGKHPMQGKPRSEETKNKLRLANIGKHYSEEAKKNMSLSQTGRKHTEETKKKMRVAQGGENHPMYGKHHTEEARRKMSKSRTGLFVGEKGSNWNPDREQVKLNAKIRSIMGELLRRVVRNKTDRTHVMLGYKKEQLIQRIESQFKPGMTWDNHGLKGWHIDHIIPVSWFVKKGTTDPKIICALDNLQPLWAKENLSKNNKYEEKGIL